MRNLHATRRVRALLLLALLLSALPVGAVAPLLLGVHPYLPADELHERFAPLARDLEARLGRLVVIDVAVSYAAHLTRVAAGEVDFAYLGPAPYIRLVRRDGPKRLLARLEVDGSPTFHGYIVTTAQSGIERLRDLRGRRFAFGDPNSTMSHLVPRAMLRQAGGERSDLGAYAHLSNHENVALGVLVGAFDAGAVKEEVYRRYAPRGLRVLARSPAVSEHLFAAADHLDEATVERLRAALLAIDSAVTLRALKANVTALVAVTDGDYDALRGLLALVPGEGADGNP